MFAPTRRSVLAGGLALAATSGLAHAKGVGISSGDTVIPLWPGTPPGGAGASLTMKTVENPNATVHPDRWLSHIGNPHLVVKRAPSPNGAAIMSIPGGGYRFLAYDNEGTEQAAWLNRQGITTFILVYRLPGEGWAHRAEVPLQDAQRAMRLIRANADSFGVDARRVGIMGFSAGGHLAGTLATRFDYKVYDPVDSADKLSARPDLVGMIYPVVTLGKEAHVGSRDALLGPASTPAERKAWSVQNNVSEGTPPIFLCNSGDDPLVPPVNSLLMYEAMLRARRPGELHSFEKGGHGFGVRLPPSYPASHWPELFTTFMRYNKLFA